MGLASITALGLFAAVPADAEPWALRTADQGTVDAIGLATATDGTPAAEFNGLVLLSVSCTDDNKKALKAPSLSFLAYSRADKRPRDITASLSVDGKSFSLAGRAYRETPYYFEVRSVPRGFLQAVTEASRVTATIKPGNLASAFDMTGAKDVLTGELEKCRK